jgi:nickel transport protein
MQHSLRLVLCALVPAVVISTASVAWAHKVNVYAYAEEDTVYVRGYFSKNPARNCRVLVFAPDGTQLVEGKTDQKGEFKFKSPVRADLRIQIIAGEGHTNSYTLEAGELSEKLPMLAEWKGKPPPAPGEDSDSEIHKQPTPDSPPPEEEQQLPPGVTLRQVEEVVDAVVERKVAPLRKMLLEQQESAQGATFERVLAGLGIIFGLMGLTLYLRSIWRDRKS